MSRFIELLRQSPFELAPETIDKLESYRNLVVEESKVQNLTRLLDPEEFYFGHVVDVAELNKLELIYPAMDLGSGCGVPGLLCSILDKNSSWTLCESEYNKAQFLDQAVESLGLDNAEVFAGRAEDFLKRNTVETIASRAVGKVLKLFRLLEPCSTWNKLILFKGPSWPEEWDELSKSKFAGQLKLELDHQYKALGKQRRIIVLKRT